ncbi:MAG: hypothetical protein WBF05_04700, partial [Anaerolineales bacterium]
DEKTALQALIDYGPRYAQVLHSREIKFQVPTNASDLVVTERHDGNATTDFGAPAIMLADFVWAYEICLAKASLSPLDMNRWHTSYVDESLASK